MIPICVRAQLLSHVWLFGTPWTAAHQAPLSMEFPRQEYWSRLPFCARNLPNPGIKPIISCICCIGRQILYHWATWEAPNDHYYYYLKRYFTSSYISALETVWSLFFLSSGTFLWQFLLPLFMNLHAEMYFPRGHTKQMHIFYYYIDSKSNGMLDMYPPMQSPFRDAQPSPTAGSPQMEPLCFHFS